MSWKSSSSAWVATPKERACTRRNKASAGEQGRAGQGGAGRRAGNPRGEREAGGPLCQSKAGRWLHARTADNATQAHKDTDTDAALTCFQALRAGRRSTQRTCVSLDERLHLLCWHVGEGPAHACRQNGGRRRKVQQSVGIWGLAARHLGNGAFQALPACTSKQQKH